jgi:hypothetical protein
LANQAAPYHQSTKTGSSSNNNPTILEAYMLLSSGKKNGGKKARVEAHHVAEKVQNHQTN